MSKTIKKTFDVDVLVTLFIRKTVTATDEEEATQLAENSIKLDTVTKAFQNGDSEIEVTGTEEV